MANTYKVALVTFISSPYIHQLMLGALSVVAGRPKLVCRDFRLPDRTLTSDAGAAYQSELNSLLRWNPDGLLCALNAQALNELVQALPQPKPTVNMFAARHQPPVMVVAGSTPGMFAVSAQHLRQLGLKSIAFLDLEDPPLHELRRRAFNQVVLPANPSAASLCEVVDPKLLEHFDEPIGRIPERLRRWLERLPKPSGIVCTTTGGGGYLIRVCQKLGLRVPEDIAVIGYDDFQTSLLSSPTLTTVQSDTHEIGRTAMELLRKVLKGDLPPPASTKVEAMELRVRESTGQMPVEICDINAAKDYIQKHACQHITVNQVIRETQHVSEKTFYTHFKAATGVTPLEAIEQRKLEEARRLLASTKISMTSISECCGFSDSNSFARFFRLKEGMSPTDYRKQGQRV